MAELKHLEGYLRDLDRTLTNAYRQAVEAETWRVYEAENIAYLEERRARLIHEIEKLRSGQTDREEQDE